MQIFVCGMHRSGTSVIARLLNMIGAYLGPEGSGLPANAENPKGFWERTDIVALNDRILAEVNARWLDPHPWLARGNFVPSAAVTQAIRARLLDMDAHRPWFIKDPRLCLTLGAWLPHCERPVVIVCSRDASAVAQSLAKHSVSLGFRLTREEADATWEMYNRSLLDAAAGITRIFLCYEDVLTAPMAAVEHLHAELVKTGVTGLRLPHPGEVSAFIDPQLQRHSSSRDTPVAPGSVASALRGLTSLRDLDPLQPSTMETLARLHERLLRMDEIGTSGIRDRAQIAAIQERVHAICASDGAAEFTWSAETLRRLLRADAEASNTTPPDEGEPAARRTD